MCPRGRGGGRFHGQRRLALLPFFGAGLGDGCEDCAPLKWFPLKTQSDMLAAGTVHSRFPHGVVSVTVLLLAFHTGWSLLQCCLQCLPNGVLSVLQCYSRLLHEVLSVLQCYS